jgi:MarR family 2-MHQ and catechol resistance regulon transcriptional repressor
VPAETDSRVTDDALIDAYGRLLETQRRLHHVFDRSLRDEVGISAVWYEALLRLARSDAGHLAVNELGNALDLTSGGATRLVDRLVDEGYLERSSCPTDRRIAWVTLTPGGQKLLDEATEVHVRDLEDHFASLLTGEEMEQLREILRRLRDG